MLHACVDAFTLWFQIGGDKLEVVFVANDSICLAYCFDDSRCDVFRAAWTDACNNNLFHTWAKLVFFCE